MTLKMNGRGENVEKDLVIWMVKDLWVRCMLILDHHNLPWLLNNIGSEQEVIIEIFENTFHFLFFR